MKQKPKLLWKICMLMAVLIMAVGYIQCGDDEGKLAKDCVDVDEDKHGEGSDCEGLDCDDNNPTIYASAQEVCGNGIDEDCDGQDTSCMADCQDGDGDLYGEGTGCKGPDCDDSNANVNPLAIEICGDSIDNDCNGEDAPCCNDKDGDGYGAGESCQENDCDDTNPNVYPGAPEICDDNLDQNCDGKDIKCSEVCLDLDSDGFGEGLGCKDKDCNDQDPAINPDAKEVCGNAVDENCDTKMDECLDCNDQDGDGYGIGADCLGTDCDDNNKDINPSAQEICGNSIDEDCQDGDQSCSATCTDGDQDGYGQGSSCLGTDCDDNNKDINPGATDICGNTIDEDCDGNDFVCPSDCTDSDKDGYGQGNGCISTDCDDNNAEINPGKSEICNQIDDDCDGNTDECPAGKVCGSSSPVCKSSLNAECNIDDDCADQFKCVASKCLALQQGDCKSDTECAPPATCDLAIGKCVDTQCPVACPSPGICDHKNKRCVECTADVHCPSDEGSNMVCIPSTAVCLATEGTGDASEFPWKFHKMIQDCWKKGEKDNHDKKYFCYAITTPVGVDLDHSKYDDRVCKASSSDKSEFKKHDVKLETAEDIHGCGMFDLDNLDWSDNIGANSNRDYCMWFDPTRRDEIHIKRCSDFSKKDYNCIDKDGDGYGQGGGCFDSDCNDLDIVVYPGAAEICGDSIDQDCKGGDQPCPCDDPDKDGYGVGSGCVDTDCDQTDPNVNPGAADICGNGKDENCDGSDAPCICTTDNDKDGYGIGQDCDGPDCDDNDPQKNPGLPEICDGKDNNCDGQIDECPTGQGCQDGQCKAELNQICSSKVPCKAGMVCSNDICKRDLGSSCQVDSDCSMGHKCDPATKKCSSDVCLLLSCPAGQVCDRNNGACVQCFNDQHCQALAPNLSCVYSRNVCAGPTSNVDNNKLPWDIYDKIVKCWNKGSHSQKYFCYVMKMPSEIDKQVKPNLYDDFVCQANSGTKTEFKNKGISYDTINDIVGCGLLDLDNLHWEDELKEGSDNEYCMWFDPNWRDEVHIDKCHKYVGDKFQCIDKDEDGYGPGSDCFGNDCNDDNASINPKGSEICNGEDDDCDGTVDECASPAKICDPAGGGCKRMVNKVCTQDSECLTGLSCLVVGYYSNGVAIKKCKVPLGGDCKSDDQCTVNAKCDPDTKKCSNDICLLLACGDKGKQCQRTTKKCVDCLDDSHCSSPNVCVPSTNKCMGPQIEFIDSDLPCKMYLAIANCWLKHKSSSTKKFCTALKTINLSKAIKPGDYETCSAKCGIRESTIEDIWGCGLFDLKNLSWSSDVPTNSNREYCIWFDPTRTDEVHVDKCTQY